MDDTVVWILVIVAVVLIAALAAWALNRNLQSRRLRQRFGPEYDRTIERTSGDRKQAESVLGDRIARREELELRPLSPAAHETYARRWDQVQAQFVDEPGTAVQDAQTLLEEVMAERGYPVGNEFEERVDLVSVDHPDVVEHYRVANRLHHESGETSDAAATTEDRRQALVHYRALFADLLDRADTSRRADTEGSDDEGDEGRERERRIP